MATLSIRIGISEAKHCHPEDENSYLTSSCNPRKHWILATLWDPLIPDPAFDRHFASYWMDQLQSESSIQKNGEKSNFYNLTNYIRTQDSISDKELRRRQRDSFLFTLVVVYSKFAANLKSRGLNVSFNLSLGADIRLRHKNLSCEYVIPNRLAV